MAKQTILKERGTGEVLYPQTLARLVQTANGGNVGEELDKAKFALFVDMWERECQFEGNKHYFGKFNKDTGFFELNEITDIAYGEALQIYARSLHTQLPKQVQQYMFGGLGNDGYRQHTKCRTYFPFFSGGGYAAIDLSYFFKENNVVETLNFIGGYGHYLSNFPKLTEAFSGCVKLRKILCVIGYPTDYGNAFKNCQALEFVNIKTYILNNTFNFQWSPKLSIESVRLLVKQAAFNSDDPQHIKTMTVNVHPSVYAKLTDETNTEWHALLALAAEKNITFATV